MKPLKVYLVLLLTLLFWASGFIGIRIGLQSYSPGALALLRFLVASLSMAIIYPCLTIKKSIPWLVRGQLLLLGVGAIGIYNICLNSGELTVTAGVASFIIGLIPVLTILLSLIHFQEKLNWGAWLGISISLFGLAILMIAEGTQKPFDTGIFTILIAAVMGAIYNVGQKILLKDYHPVEATAWVIWGGTCVLLWFYPDLLKEFPQANAQVTGVVIYMGIFPAAIAYAAWCYVLTIWSASKAAIFLYALPILSTVMGVLILKEEPSSLSLLGGGLALTGAIIANWLRTLPIVQMREIHGVES